MAICVTLPVRDDSDDLADYIRDTVAPVATIAQVHLSEDGVTISIPDAGADLLRSLPEDADGHLDPDGQLWIGGTEYRTWPDAHDTTSVVIDGHTISEAAPGAFASINIHAPGALPALARYLTGRGLTAVLAAVGFRYENQDRCRRCSLQRQVRAVADLTVTAADGGPYEARVDLVDCHCGQHWA